MILSIPGERHTVAFQPHSRVLLEVGQTQLEVLGENSFNSLYGFTINAPAALVDPVEINIDAERGYKGIRDNEPLSIGRHHTKELRRFDHLAEDVYLSRTHARLLLASGELAITHASTTGSTIIGAEDASKPLPESPGLITPDATMSVYASVASFAQQCIPLQESIHSDLPSLAAEELYVDWYRRGTVYVPSPPSKTMSGQYSATQRKPDIEEELVDSNVHHLDTRFAVFRKPGASHSTRGPGGRLFLNTDPAYAPLVLNRLSAEAQRHNVAITGKILRDSTDPNDRIDSCMVSFNGQNSSVVLQSMQQVHAQHGEAFRAGTPQLCQPVHGPDGQPLQGVGFGQNPSRKRQSFGVSRCVLLAEALYALHQNREPITAYTLWNSFGRLATRHDVDPQNPAFNFRDAVLFSVFR